MVDCVKEKNIIESLKQALAEIKNEERRQEEWLLNALQNLSEILKSIATQFGDVNKIDANQVLCTQLLVEDIPMILINHLIHLNVDATRSVNELIRTLLGFRIDEQFPTREYFQQNFTVIFEQLLNSLKNSSSWPPVEILMSFMQHEHFAAQMLNMETLTELGLIIADNEEVNFELSSAAQYFFWNLLLSHPQMVADFVMKNFDAIFELISAQVDSTVHVLARYTANKLHIFLYEQTNRPIMLKFVAEDKYAALVIEKVLNSRVTMKLQIWSVFILFIANPNKPPAVKKLLIRRREEILEGVEQLKSNQFCQDRDEEAEQADHVLKILKELTED